ncbi:formylglycine-generating enzyme family protein [Leucobacter allii]|uniref:formylglycine-generating enzyme family protein n=1 Tax=Leucobacter allii TaxID=2932247 RepID=UPI001FD5B53F|nr:SUMF1/EgtB/PvdO family nonheme iron enzyme [Leucobacter allii]UOR02201.1 formylglycine-generating enzyme family protein [Leucobacter allii]
MATLIRIPGGSVRLRDARRGTARTVALRSFEIAATPLTVDEFRTRRAIADARGAPIAGVTWLDAVRWCNSASDSESLPPAYTITGDAVRWDPASPGYRLPTEAEWVHAALAGSMGPRYGELAAIAWSSADAVLGPQPVASKEPNAFGVYDMLGNVWEWCWDRLDPARYGDYRVFKGGGWADPPWSCRVGVRRGNAPDAVVEDVGLRVARGSVGAIAAHGGQGWSEAADRERAAVATALPPGWTPLRPGGIPD